MATTREQPRLNAGGSSDGDIDLLRAAPIVVRLAFAAWMRATGWTLQASLAAWVRVLRGAANGESPTELIREVEDELRTYLRNLLGVESANGTGAGDVEPVDAEVVEDDRATPEKLREQARDLLRRSADVNEDDETHPAYERILENLAPDEARILRLLYQEGPQPAVDVRTVGPLAVGRSELVAPGLNMVAQAAGCRRPKRVFSYMNNLYRLGLIWFSREPLDDPLRYQVLEAQPEVTQAMEEAGRGKTVRRSIHLTAFGEEFCNVCLPMDTGEIDQLPRDRGR